MSLSLTLVLIALTQWSLAQTVPTLLDMVGLANESEDHLKVLELTQDLERRNLEPLSPANKAFLWRSRGFSLGRMGHYVESSRAYFESLKHLYDRRAIENIVAMERISHDWPDRVLSDLEMVRR